MNLFNKNGLNYKIKKNKTESLFIFEDRLKFIMEQNPKNYYQLNEVILYSKIYINVKYYGCEYYNDVMNRLNWFIKNIKNID